MKQICQDVKDAVVHLRFFTNNPTRLTKLHYRYAQIAAMTGLSKAKVQQICLGALPGNQGRYGLR